MNLNGNLNFNSLITSLKLPSNTIGKSHNDIKNIIKREIINVNRNNIINDNSDSSDNESSNNNINNDSISAVIIYYQVHREFSKSTDFSNIFSNIESSIDVIDATDFKLEEIFKCCSGLGSLFVIKWE